MGLNNVVNISNSTTPVKGNNTSLGPKVWRLYSMLQGNDWISLRATTRVAPT